MIQKKPLRRVELKQSGLHLLGETSSLRALRLGVERG